MDEPVRRDELLAGYQRPYVRWLPVAWRMNSVPQLAIAALMVDVAAVVAQLVLIDGVPDPLLVLAALVTLVAVVWSVWTTIVAVQVIRERTRRWKAGDTELERVRVRRTHAPEADQGVAHDEFAVAVEDEGDLVTWRFSPLAADERAPAGALLLPGVPNYAAREVARTPFDPEDAAHAAEQLAEAQYVAAEREGAAAEEVREALRDLERRRALAGEARSTAQALRRHTGQ